MSVILDVSCRGFCAPLELPWLLLDASGRPVVTEVSRDESGMFSVCGKDSIIVSAGALELLCDRVRKKKSVMKVAAAISARLKVSMVGGVVGSRVAARAR